MTGRHPERLRVQALDDEALVRAMRDGDEWAWGEFVARARPVLDGYVRRARLDAAECAACADELLTSVALHLASPGAPTPTRLAPYLLRAALRCRRQVARNRGRRAAWHEAAARDDLGLGIVGGVGVVGRVTSEWARRAAEPDGDDAAGGPAVRAVMGVVRALAAELRPSDVELLTWYADGVPHRQIAEWLGVSYAAAAKRVQRLCDRAALRARALAAGLPRDERAALERLLRRAEHAALASAARVAEPNGDYAPGG